jgi:hypothetical protein
MEWLIATIVTVIQLALAGFLMWGGWLVLGETFRQQRADAAAADPLPAARPQAQANDFERVASLVLLALLCTTLVAAA